MGGISSTTVGRRTTWRPDGTQRQILRENMPFGSLGAGEFGTYFIGYAATPSVTELMLQHMFLGDPPGNYDRILDFSTAVTGSLFFVPTADFLDDPPPLPGDARDAASAGNGTGDTGDAGIPDEASGGGQRLARHRRPRGSSGLDAEPGGRAGLRVMEAA
jgi:putative iron-dependent peroxidase